MTMTRCNRWWALMALATLMVMVGALLSPPLAQARDNTLPPDTHTPGADGFTAPAPTKSDKSGTDQDEYYIPDAYYDGTFNHPTYGFGSYLVNGKSQQQGWHSTKGASSVTVTTDFDSGTWTFYFSDEVTGTEAKNKYSVVVDTSRCYYGDGTRYRKVTAYVENVADKTGRSIHSFYPATDHPSYSVFGTESVENIGDGEMVAVPIWATPRIHGLEPDEDKYTVRLRQNDTDYAGGSGDYTVKTVRITVPSCQRTGSQDGVARGHLKRLGHRGVRVVANARKVSSGTTKFRIVKRVAGKKKAAKRVFKVKAGTVRRLVVKKPAKRNAVFVLQAYRSDKGKFVKLDRQRVSARR